MSIGCRVVLAVAFQQIDNAPDTQTCAQGDHKDLQSINSACKKCHNVPPLISEILICDMAVLGQKQKSHRTVLEKICFKQHGGMGQEKSCGYLLFRENHESSKKPPFIVTKTKPAKHHALTGRNNVGFRL